ncbi:MAG: hypothetical protein ACI8VE_002019, partial [Natrialbaceae archaeon]
MNSLWSLASSVPAGVGRNDAPAGHTYTSATPVYVRLELDVQPSTVKGEEQDKDPS